MHLTINLEEKFIIIKKSFNLNHQQKLIHLKIHFNFFIQQIYQPTNISWTNAQQFKAILGIKIIQNVPFLVVVKQNKQVCTFEGKQIFQIKSIDWIPITENYQLLENQDIKAELNKISELFEQGLHYYSDSYCLWKTYLQNIIQNNTKEQEKYQEQFLWNSNLIKMDYKNLFKLEKKLTTNKYFLSKKSLKEQSTQKQKIIDAKQVPHQAQSYESQSKILEKWCTPIIQGYVDIFQNMIGHQKLVYLLISRRSNSKAGTRFFSRGVDDFGNVANYTQTQQIILLSDYTITSLQIRGSVPVFFQQLGIQGINIQLNIQRTQQLTKKAFLSHFFKINQTYNRVLTINLLTQKKKSEQTLTCFYQKMLEQNKSQLPYVKYLFFDFHQQCKNDKFQNTKQLINKIEQIIQVFGYNVFDKKSKKLLKVQNGIFRTNCLDCLDRTNYVQSRIGLEIFGNVLKEFGGEGGMKEKVEKEGLLKQESFQTNSEVLNSFNRLWAENGDSISMHYTGIGSTHTDITKTGKRTLFGTVNHKMRSLMRFYTQFTDINKHQAINQLLGNKSRFGFDFSPEGRQDKQFTKQQILVISWQFKDIQQSIKDFQANPYNNSIFTQLLQKIQKTSKKSPNVSNLQPTNSIIVINLFIPNKFINWQSFKFDFKNITSPFSNKQSSQFNQLLTLWSDFLTSQLESQKLKYILIDKNETQTNKMLIFCHKNLIENVSNIKKDQIVSSLNTKQSVLISKFKINESSLIFQSFNVKDFKSFVDYCQKCHKKAFQQASLGKAKSTSVSQQSYKIILGNLGVQSKLPQQIFANLISNYHQACLQYKILEQNQKSSNYPQVKIQKIQTIINLLNKSCQSDQLKLYLQKNTNNNSSKNNSESYVSLINYNQSPLQFIPQNNRILFWNEESRIVTTKEYQEIGYRVEDGNKNENRNNSKQNEKMKSSESQNTQFLQKCVHLSIICQIQAKNQNK